MAEKADIGVIGLGVMGANLALNLAEHGFRVAVFDRDASKGAALTQAASGNSIALCPSEPALVEALTTPAALLLSVPAGEPTDAAIEALARVLKPGDIIIDAGNADFNDTRRRTEALAAKGLQFIGMGVSGGAEGARHGPALMAGGSAGAWDSVSSMMTAIAARHGDQPCAARLGPDGAGHFVKTVHNGIEYADMQMIAEIYGVMRDGLGLDHDAIAKHFAAWSSGPLSSYLIDITAEVAGAVDPETRRPILDLIADRAGQKGTGRWTLVEAHRLGTVAGTIEAAVAARTLSSATTLRSALEGSMAGPVDVSATDLHDALHAGKIISYAQGFDLLHQASEAYSWALDRGQIARLWRAGCIIRAAMLDDISAAFKADPSPHLLSAPDMASALRSCLGSLRAVVSASITAGLPVPALASALGYVDQLTQPRGTANMIQGLRDRFGAHGFERVDLPGADHHGPWSGSTGG